MGLKTAFKRFFDLDEEAEEMEEKPEIQKKDEPSEPSGKNEKKQNVVSLKSIHQQTKVILSEPKTFDDVETIADHLKNRRTVVVNLQRLSREQAKSILDFMSGVVFALDADIQKLGADTFMFAPENVDISGMISELLDEDKF
ncbi:cell division inhibitor SepF [Scopulibacillus darangshiensis]|uniref:Cell division protein SepF n=1 Tax=Scopulibacillus darangshiensis TaxID=442528 RepID=A0A4R2P5P4_9BACL|nr:cell division protein SepF [Scopulibacillus darangshiensis]TCP29105.1 cell division inhibitor SepF [Scopulibacillus darangshiensis]